MHNLNEQNGAAPILLDVAKRLAEEVKDRPLIGAELGIAYGGGVEAIGKIWKPVNGTIYGLDTFAGHPKKLATSLQHHEAFCMDPHYQHFGMDTLSYEYQRKVLDSQGLKNVVLRKGLINENSLDGIPYLHYALLDLDLIVSMTLGWTIVRPKVLSGGYLCLHDVVPREHIVGLWGLYQEILACGEYELVQEYPQSYLVVLKRK